MSEYIYRSNGEPLVNERGEISLALAGEIVRCRDCRHFEEIKGMFKWCSFHNMDVEEHDFCSKGERREGC